MVSCETKYSRIWNFQPFAKVHTHDIKCFYGVSGELKIWFWFVWLFLLRMTILSSFIMGIILRIKYTIWPPNKTRKSSHPLIVIVIIPMMVKKKIKTLLLFFATTCIILWPLTYILRNKNLTSSDAHSPLRTIFHNSSTICRIEMKLWSS